MQNSYTETAVTLFGLGMLALGTLAMIVRAFVRHRQTLHTTGQQFVADVRRGEGFTFHKQIGDAKSKHAPPTLRLREWLNLVNHHPDEVPHLFIEGGSGGGKTTLALAILGDRNDLVAVVGVKPDDAWGTGYVFKSDARQPALVALVAEVRRRLDDNDRSGLTVVLDDFTRLASDHKEAIELYKLIADVGRSLRIRLILIARGRLVKGIGASGESDLRDHFVFIVVSRSHSATLEYDEGSYPIETAQAPDLAQPISAARWWRVTDTTPAQASERGGLLAALLTQPTGASAPQFGETTPKHSEMVSASVSGVATPQSDDEMIAVRVLAKLIQAGLLTETKALEGAFDVRAGSSRDYKRVQGKLRQALADLEAHTPVSTA